MTTIIGRWAQPPDFIEPIVGFRAWHFTRIDQEIHLYPFMLFGTDHPLKNDWEGAWITWVTASCPSTNEPGHVAPDESCTCGFYATKSADDLEGFAAAILIQVRPSPQAEALEGVVFGRVFLAGKVIEHDTGYRAERARIKELTPTTTDAGITTSLASRLGLPVGPSIDTTAINREIEEEIDRSSSPPWRPGPLDRLRLKRHARHFRLIQGARGD